MRKEARILIRALVYRFHYLGMGLGLPGELTLLVPEEALEEGEEGFATLLFRQWEFFRLWEPEVALYRSETLLQRKTEERLLYWAEGTLEDYVMEIAPTYWAPEVAGELEPPKGIPGLRADGSVCRADLLAELKASWYPVYLGLGSLVQRGGIEGFLHYYRLLREEEGSLEAVFPDGLALCLNRHGERYLLVEAAHPLRGSLAKAFYSPDHPHRGESLQRWLSGAWFPGA